MTPQSAIAALQRLHEGATPLPWSVFGSDRHVLGITYEDAGRLRCVHRQWTHNCSEQDADLIAAARNALPNLLVIARILNDFVQAWTGRTYSDVDEPVLVLNEIARGAGEALSALAAGVGES